VTIICLKYLKYKLKGLVESGLMIYDNRCLAFVRYFSQILMCTCHVKCAIYLFIYNVYTKAARHFSISSNPCNRLACLKSIPEMLFNPVDANPVSCHCAGNST